MSLDRFAIACTGGTDPYTHLIADLISRPLAYARGTVPNQNLTLATN
jgi:hypothetical protein